MDLFNDIPVRLKGFYTIKYTMTSGSAELQFQVADEGFDIIENTNKTVTASFDIDIGHSDVKAILTGDAKAFAIPIRP